MKDNSFRIPRKHTDRLELPQGVESRTSLTCMEISGEIPKLWQNGDILKVYSKSLLVLKLSNFEKDTSRMHFTMSPFYNLDLQKLEELHMWGYVVEDFYFLKSLPRIELLYIDFAAFDKLAGVMVDFDTDVDSSDSADTYTSSNSDAASTINLVQE